MHDTTVKMKDGRTLIAHVKMDGQNMTEELMTEWRKAKETADNAYRYGEADQCQYWRGYADALSIAVGIVEKEKSKANLPLGATSGS